MVFSSMSFLAFFLPITIILYFLSSNSRWRNGVLLVFSLLFYAWGEPQRILLMLASILVNYAAALLIDRAQNIQAKRILLALGLCITMGVLFYFKYFAFFVNSLASLLGLEFLVDTQSLPIGVSFYTFQIITYTVDVYLGKTPVQRSLPKLMLYISFFPQLIAGPIVNYTYIAPYLSERKTSWADAYAGFTRFIIGLSKKVLLANICGEIVSELGLTGEMSVLAAWLGAVAYTLQIYFDFSGYSDMAIGMGQIFGFKFLENFNYPYLSTTVTEFWRRWHISLGAFFREYVYIPLGGNRVCRVRQIVNLVIVWALTGLWHGASWNFVVWGLYYGLLLILEKHLFPRVIKAMPKALRWLITMLLVILGWVLFYHESLGNGIHQIASMFGIGAASGSDAVALYYLKRYFGILLAACAACIPWRSLAPAALCTRLRRSEACTQLVRGIIASVLLVLSVAFMVSGSYNPFLYFRF